MAKETSSFNVAFQDNLLLAADNSPFEYSGYTKSSHYAQDHLPLEPKYNFTGWGSTLTLPVEAGKYHLGKIQLIVDLGPLTCPSASFVRFQDYLGYQIIESIKATQFNNPLGPELKTDDLVLHYNLHYDEEERRHQDPNIAANLAEFERTDLAKSAQHLLIEIPLWWTKDPSFYVNMKPLGQPIHITIKFKKLADIVQTDTPTIADLSCSLDNASGQVFLYTQPEEILNRQAARFNSKLPRQKQGLLKKVLLAEKMENIQMKGGLGNTEFKLKVDGIKGQVAFFVFIIRKASAVSASGGPNQDILTFQKIKSFRLMDKQTVVVREVDDRLCRKYLMPHWFSGVMGNYIYGWSYSFAPEMSIVNSVGHLTHGSFADPRLVITLDAPIAEDHRCDFYAFSHNFAQQKDDALRVLFE
jgi:hypothetical protein